MEIEMKLGDNELWVKMNSLLEWFNPVLVENQGSYNYATEAAVISAGARGELLSSLVVALRDAENNILRKSLVELASPKPELLTVKPDSEL